MGQAYTFWTPALVQSMRIFLPTVKAGLLDYTGPSGQETPYTGLTHTLCVSDSRDASNSLWRGRPHLTNMYGKRFGLYHTGVNVLQIPRLGGLEETLLHLEAYVTRMRGAFYDVYFEIMKISGHWTKRSGKFEFFATSDGKANSVTLT